MYSISYSKRFEKDLKRCKKRGLDIQLIKEAIELLAATGKLPSNYRPHKLVNKKMETWECHIEPDWLLVYQIKSDRLILRLLRTGTHSDLF